jgi:hypothetical protein
MPVSIGPILMLGSALLLAGSEAVSRPGVEANPISRHLSSIAIAAHPMATIQAMPPGAEWPWRISEANTTEEESAEGDELGPLKDDSSRGRLSGDRSVTSPIRPDLGGFRSPFRSPILRC